MASRAVNRLSRGERGRFTPLPLQSRDAKIYTVEFSTVISEAYAQALYSFVYSRVGLAGCDNIRYTYGFWLDQEVGTDVFHDNICRAWAVGAL